MPFLDLPPAMQERVVCSVTAAIKYEVPANIVLAVAEKENGKPGQRVRNTNGTDDVGTMQFNTSYLKTLRKYDITPEDVAQPGCYAYDLAAWRLRGHIKNDSGDIWTRAANYHSRTPKFNTIYRTDLIKVAGKWEKWLASRFNTYDVNSSTAPAVIASASAVDGTPKERTLAIPPSDITLPAETAREDKPKKTEPAKVQKVRYNEAAERALAAVYAPNLRK